MQKSFKYHRNDNLNLHHEEIIICNYIEQYVMLKKYRIPRINNALKENNECSICHTLIEITVNYGLYNVEKCGHAFHRKCLKSYFKKQTDNKILLTAKEGKTKCPICKAETTNKDMIRILGKQKYCQYKLKKALRLQNEKQKMIEEEEASKKPSCCPFCLIY